MTIEERLEFVKGRIARACARVGRDPGGVRLVAVSKYIDALQAGRWVRAGLTDLGENRWRVAKEKVESFGGEVTWHFIGHLQTNKVKPVVEHFTWLHSLDRLSLVDALAKRLGEVELAGGRPFYTLVQVNVAGEETKSGIPPEDVGDLLDYIHGLRRSPRWKMAGFMTMAPRVREAEEAREVFRGLREIRDRFADHPVWEGRSALELSMGMSDDYEVAVEEGATMVRLGRVLLGDEGAGGAADSE
ncbi:MAG: YggS family pyridoxal phosphate-dependent enzyme [Kyrpidia sp.]|nr:YggS family pyridoxal phosphate-dependent enzyme [Kyrpidia sp.]